MLELFSGTGRLAAEFRERGWETVTLDSGCEADIRCDITDWDYSDMQLFDHVRMSPPCTNCSESLLRRSERGACPAQARRHVFDGEPSVWEVGSPQAALHVRV